MQSVVDGQRVQRIEGILGLEFGVRIEILFDLE